jgi:hypothetical protein
MNTSKINVLFTVLFIITSIYYFPITNYNLGPYNEAVILVGAERILEGQIPYKDFFTIYPPGQVYAVAGLFKLFGTSVIVERIYDIIIRSLLSMLVFLIIRFLSSNKIALVGWAMSLIWLGHSGFPAYPVYPSILFSYISVYLLLLHMKEQRYFYHILSAVAIVFATLFRHDLGGYTAIVITFVLLLRRITGAQKTWTPLVSYISSGIMAGLPVLIYFFLISDIELMINELILFPANVFPDHLELPYPPLSRYNLPFFVFPSVLMTGVITSLILIKRKKDNTKAYGVLLISFVGILFFNQVRVRSDIIHLLPVALTAILLAPILLYTFSRSQSTWQNRVVYVLFVIIFGITLSKPISDSKRIISRSKGYVISAVNPEIERAKYLNIHPDLKSTALYVKKNTSEDEHIYVGVKNHDKVLFNFPIIYFLSERNCATKYHEFNSGLINTLSVQEEIVNELRTKSVRMVVLAPGWHYEPNLSSIDTQINLLDDFIATNYKLIKAFGIYEIWMKKNNLFLNKYAKKN